jgi:hypothetical protein
MSDAEVLRGLLLAFGDGDLLARRALLDYLDEAGDPRLEAVRREDVDWMAVARELCGPADDPRQRPSYHHPGVASGDLGRFRYYVDCARFGAGATPAVEQAVRDARRRWLQGLFPEVDLAAPP